jgi:hypothetical protein
MSEQQLLLRYRASRRRLNATLDLIDRAIDLREQLWFGLDLDHMREEVRAFCKIAQRWRDRRAA